MGCTSGLESSRCNSGVLESDLHDEDEQVAHKFSDLGRRLIEDRLEGGAVLGCREKQQIKEGPTRFDPLRLRQHGRGWKEMKYWA